MVLRSDCPVNAAVEIFGDKWSLVIVRELVFGGPRSFRRLQEELKEGIASNILSDRLRRLVDAGILDKTPGARRTVVYRAAEPAVDLVPVLATIGGWGARHGGIPESERAAPIALEESGPGSWRELQEEIRRRDRVAT